MTLPPLVSLGDLLRVYRRLEVPPERWADVRTHLGLDLAPAMASLPSADEREEITASVPTDAPSASANEPTREASPRQPRRTPRERRSSAPLASRLQSLPRQEARQPRLLASKLIGAADAGEHVVDVSPEPLFVPSWTREILIELLLMPGGDGPFDAVAAVAMFARQEPLNAVPRLPRQTLSHGAQVLIDAGDALVPFTRDKGMLVSDLERVLGAPSLEVLRFAGTPLRGAGRGRRRQWGRWQPPARPKPIVVVSDLGIAHPRSGGDRALPSEWRRFAEHARRARCPVVAVVPYPRERVSRALLQLIAVVEWDRGTTAAHVRRWVGERRREA